MAFTQTATIPGAAVVYQLAKTAKRYTLKDNGFTETTAGNFQLVRPLDATPQSKEGIKLKIVVAKDLKAFKLSVTTANGLKAVDIFKNKNHELLQEKFYFLMDGMISRGLFEKV